MFAAVPLKDFNENDKNVGFTLFGGLELAEEGYGSHADETSDPYAHDQLISVTYRLPPQ